MRRSRKYSGVVLASMLFMCSEVRSQDVPQATLVTVGARVRILAPGTGAPEPWPEARSRRSLVPLGEVLISYRRRTATASISICPPPGRSATARNVRAGKGGGRVAV